MSDFGHRNQTSGRRSDYVWQYEYYDDEEPVSFEGLKAHRYSIVIGFWVGLAVFVIFMFFVLTLLTKTGGAHQENQDSAEKLHRTESCLADSSSPEGENGKAFSRSFFHFYINEESHSLGKHKPEDQTFGRHSRTRAQAARNGPARISSCVMEVKGEEVEEIEGCQTLEGLIERNNTDRECALLSHFNIPNFVHLENGSTLGEDDLLYEPSIILERQSNGQDVYRDIH